MNAPSKKQGSIVVPKVDAVRRKNHYKKNLPPRRADSPQVETPAVKLGSPDPEKYLIAPSIFLLQFHYDLEIKNPNKVEETREHSSAELMEMLAKSFEKSEALLKALREVVG